MTHLDDQDQQVNVHGLCVCVRVRVELLDVVTFATNIINQL